MNEKALAVIAWSVVAFAAALFAWSVGIKAAATVVGISVGILALIWALAYLAIFYSDDTE